MKKSHKTNLDRFVKSRTKWQLFMMHLVGNVFAKTVDNILEGNMMFLADETGIDLTTGKRKPGRPNKSVGK